MKQVTYLETAADLFDAARREREAANDDRPVLPHDAELHIYLAEGSLLSGRVQLLHAPEFMLADDISAQDILKEACRRAGVFTTVGDE